MQSSDLSFFDALRAGTLTFAYGIPPWAFVALSPWPMPATQSKLCRFEARL